MVSRRTVLKGIALSLGAPMLNRGRFALFAQSATEYSVRTVDLVRRCTVIDMLGLLTLDYRKLTAWEADPGRFRQADFLRLKASGITVFHPSVGYTAGDIYAESLRDIQGWNAFLAAHLRSVEDVESFYRLGQRVSQLTYRGNRIGGGSSDPRDDGLTQYGVEIVERMNEVGMAVDISHCGDRTTMNAIEASRKPVLITHS